MKDEEKREEREILALLPETLPRDIMEGAIRSVAQEGALGETEFLLFTRESAVDTDEQYWMLNPPESKPRWAARCVCGACGGEWQSGWQDRTSIRAYMDEDGTLYTGIPEGDIDEQLIAEGDKVVCPLCGATVTTVARSSLKNGRTYQCMTARIENLGDYTAVIYWMLGRIVRRDGASDYYAQPWAAAVVGRGGNIHCYTHATAGYYGKRMAADSWQHARMREPMNWRYHSWEAINRTMVGGWCITDVPELGGTTGEKTGLDAYLRGGGSFPAAYLLRWRSKPHLENLIKAGWTYTVDSAIAKEIGNNASRGHELRRIADLSRAKPKDMLGMTREQVRRFGKECWKLETAALWRDAAWRDPEEMLAFEKRYGDYELPSAIKRYGLTELRRIDGYLRKQVRRNENIPVNGMGLTIYNDYRNMLAAAGGGETDIELYPPSLRRAHDRLALEKKAIEAKKYDAAFAKLAEDWAALEWSDGEICAVLPRSGAELAKEGKALRHCVGGYAGTHAAGKIIVFIRHARRPERSWFTLNIDLTGKNWREIQLHGYGNEWAHGKHLRIPEKVRAFVDRWEHEVLAPTFRRVKGNEHRKAKRKKAMAA